MKKQLEVIRKRYEQHGGDNARGFEDIARADECHRLMELMRSFSFNEAVQAERDRLISLESGQRMHYQVGNRLHELSVIADLIGE